MNEMLTGLDDLADAWVEGEYRYELTRTWDAAVEKLTMVMLNPSTADAREDDPTIRRCVAFAKRDGWGGLRVLNLYALRATDPAALKRHRDPVGPHNNAHLREVFKDFAQEGRSIVAAWGVNADPDRVREVLQLRPELRWRALGKTKAGHPRHPLYVRGDALMLDWEAIA